MPSLPRRMIAEAIGTFALIFFGCAAIITTNYPGADFKLLGIALAHALALSIAVTATMNISGGHCNPAVTAGFIATRRISAADGLAYIVAQLAGSVLAGVTLKLLYPAGVARVVGYGTPTIASAITFNQAIALEAVLTFFLVSAVFGTAVSPNAPKVGGFGIGLTLVFAILAGGPLTGAALNPARAFGPAVVSGQWVGQIVWWIGPLIGGVVAALLWHHVLLPKEQTGQ